jgi:hypothetical protein
MTEYGHEYMLLPAHKKQEYLDKLRLEQERKRVKEDSSIRKLGVHAAADIRTTTRSILEATATLPDRAGYAIMSFGARTDYASSAQPFDAIPDCLDGFFETVLGIPPALLAQKAETYILKGGLAAVHQDHKRVEIRAKLTEYLRLSFGKFLFMCSKINILTSTSFIEEVAGSGARIFYEKWRTKTSIANQVVLVGWPPKTPYNPNRFRLPLLKQLLDAVEQKKIYYQEMEGEEVLRAAKALVDSGYPNHLSPPSEEIPASNASVPAVATSNPTAIASNAVAASTNISNVFANAATVNTSNAALSFA